MDISVFMTNDTGLPFILVIQNFPYKWLNVIVQVKTTKWGWRGKETVSVSIA